MNVPQRNYYYICDRYHTLISTDTHFLCPNQLMRRHQRSHFLAYSCLARRHSRGHAFPVNTLSCNSVPDNRREFADSGDFPLPAYPVWAALYVLTGTITNGGGYCFRTSHHLVYKESENSNTCTDGVASVISNPV